MNLQTLKATLREHAGKQIRLVLPEGDPIPAHFHITEVGHASRRFIDCGGTVRVVESCLLQTWVPTGDTEHRLNARKLAKILDLSREVVPSDKLDVEIEYGPDVVAQFTVESFETHDETVTFTLGNKKTDCLARESCGVEAATASACCGGQGCGCT